MEAIAKIYEQMINLEALDRQLSQDAIRFANEQDQLGVDIVTEARRAVQNDSFALQQVYDELKARYK